MTRQFLPAALHVSFGILLTATSVRPTTIGHRHRTANVTFADPFSTQQTQEVKDLSYLQLHTFLLSDDILLSSIAWRVLKVPRLPLSRRRKPVQIIPASLHLRNRQTTSIPLEGQRFQSRLALGLVSWKDCNLFEQVVHQSLYDLRAVHPCGLLHTHCLPNCFWPKEKKPPKTLKFSARMHFQVNQANVEIATSF